MPFYILSRHLCRGGTQRRPADRGGGYEYRRPGGHRPRPVRPTRRGGGGEQLVGVPPDLRRRRGRGQHRALSRAVYGFFDNGGGRCYVVNVRPGDPLAGGSRRRPGLDLLEAVDEVAIVAAPGYSDAGSYEALLSHCERLGDRVAILDPPEQVSDVDQLTWVATAGPPKPSTSDGPSSSPTVAPPALSPPPTWVGSRWDASTAA